jgi:hypothetical protein
VRAEIDLPLGLHDTREDFFDATTLGRVARHKNEATGVAAGFRQGDVSILGGVLKKAVRHLHQDAGAVARVDLATASAAMVEVLQNLDGVTQDGIRFAPLNIRDETEATGIVLVGWIVQALLTRTGGGGG